MFDVPVADSSANGILTSRHGENPRAAAVAAVGGGSLVTTAALPQLNDVLSISDFL